MGSLGVPRWMAFEFLPAEEEAAEPRCEVLTPFKHSCALCSLSFLRSALLRGAQLLDQGLLFLARGDVFSPEYSM